MIIIPPIIIPPRPHSSKKLSAFKKLSESSSEVEHKADTAQEVEEQSRRLRLAQQDRYNAWIRGEQ